MKEIFSFFEQKIENNNKYFSKLLTNKTLGFLIMLPKVH